MFYHTVDSILDALDMNHEYVIAGRLSGESLYAEAAKIIRGQQAEIERLKRYIGSYVEVAQQYKRELDECRTLLDRVFRDPGPVCETAGTHTDFAYFWRTDWLKLKADYEAARAAGGE